MKTIGLEERRARLGIRHRLAKPGRSVEQVAGDLVGLHSSDPATVFLSARARVVGFEPADLEDALYERRSLVRMLGMRRTLFVVPTDLAAVIDEACTKALAPGERTRLIRLLEEQGVADDGPAWLDDVQRRTIVALTAAGEASAAELKKEVPELEARLSFGEGRRWAGTMGVSTRVLFLLATEGTVVRVRPRGAWTSGQYRWTTTARWLREPLPKLGTGEACTELLGRWLKTFGPATLTDIRWWTGWTARLANTTLASLEAVQVELGDSEGFVLAGDLRAAKSPGPWVALLPGLDSTTMGWKERDWYLGPHGSELFDRNGNAGPTVWADGHVVGGWGQAADGEVLVELLESVDARTGSAIGAEAERLRTWLGEVRVKPRFPTPLEKRLTGSTPPDPPRRGGS